MAEQEATFVYNPITKEVRAAYTNRTEDDIRWAAEHLPELIYFFASKEQEDEHNSDR